MQGILLRPASHAADARQRGDDVEVRWRIRPSTPSGKARSSGSRGRRRTSATRELLETLAVLAAVGVLAAVMYVHVRSGGTAL
jgi:hypothetical protein